MDAGSGSNSQCSLVVYHVISMGYLSMCTGGCVYIIIELGLNQFDRLNLDPITLSVQLMVRISKY